MVKAALFSDYRDMVVYAAEGPQPQILMVNDKVKIIIAGLEAGQTIPAHTENSALYHFLEGEGWMVVDGERLAVQPGTTIVMPEGTIRGVEAESRLAFLAARIA